MNKSKIFESELIRDDESGLWIYEIPNVIFNSDESIEYWYFVEHYGLGYFSDQMIVTIEGELGCTIYFMNFDELFIFKTIHLIYD